jgi:hypothetical protein
LIIRKGRRRSRSRSRLTVVQTQRVINRERARSEGKRNVLKAKQRGDRGRRMKSSGVDKRRAQLVRGRSRRSSSIAGCWGQRKVTGTDRSGECGGRRRRGGERGESHIEEPKGAVADAHTVARSNRRRGRRRREEATDTATAILKLSGAQQQILTVLERRRTRNEKGKRRREESCRENRIED